MFKSTFQSPFQNPFPTEGAVAAEDWWLSGGISAGDCVAAYQAKGAASLAASYENLNNVGVYDLTVGSAPTWDTINGWDFNGLSNQYLLSGIVPANGSYSMVVRISGVIANESGYIFGSYDGSVGYGIRPHNGASSRAYIEQAVKGASGSGANSGVYAVSNQIGYYNGADDVIINTASGTYLEIYIGALNVSGSPSFYYRANIQSLSIYSVNITPAQVLAVTNAMNLL